MDLIATHINADFDGLGSLVAARKLYPDSRLLLPGSQEEAVRDFLSLGKDLVTIETEKGLRLDDIERLILVDTRHRSRIGAAGELIDRGVEVHIYDHHPRTKYDIRAERDVYEEVGATVTILADIIKKRKIRLTPLEATIMLVGIYEETGSLTYRSTTRLDVDMVSFLLSCGANLGAVSSYLNRELTEQELSFLTRLINSTERVLIKDVSVSIIEVDGSGYEGEVGTLINKLMEIENIPAVFVFIKKPSGRIHLIARSKTASLDVNRALSSFEGGGHSTAASAKIDGGDIKDLRERLIRVLKAVVKTRLYARDVMNPMKPVVVNLNDRVERVKSILAEKNLGGALVSDRGKIAGVVSLDNLNQAIRHGLGHARVKGYMSTKVATVGLMTSAATVRKIMFERGVGVIPVFKGRRLIGVINRTDLLKKLHNGIFFRPHSIRKAVTLNLARRMEAILPRDIFALLRRIGIFANDLGYSAFVVGGLVRDLTLGTKNIDLDIVIEGDAITFGKALSAELKGALVAHRRFGTASVVIDWPKRRRSPSGEGRLKIDLATARQESYERPAALPRVEFSSLKDDLYRRDFTINAMAVSLNKKSFGQLIDFFGGEKDLAGGRIKVMHDASFIDDPTRIFRAVRFEQRFGFAIDAHTEELIRHAVKKEMFDKTSGERIRDEILLMLREDKPIKMLTRMKDLHEFRFIHHRIRLDRPALRLLERSEGAIRWYEGSSFGRRSIERHIVYLIALLNSLNHSEVEDICDRFVFKKSDRIRILSFKERSRSILRKLNKRGEVAPSAIYKALEPLSYETILAIYAKANPERARRRIEDFLSRYNGMRLAIKGEDIKSFGLKPSPQFKEVLEKVLYRKIDGRLKTKRDELEFARKIVARKVKA